MRSRAALLAGFLLLLAARGAVADYPEMRRLAPSDPLFRQLQADLQRYFQAVSRPRDPEALPSPLPALKILAVRVPEGMDLFALAARLNLPYDTLASLNGLANPGALEPGALVLVPTLPGLYVPVEPATTFEEILASVSATRRAGGEEIRVAVGGRNRGFRFFVGESFTAVERAYFLNILFRFPLPDGILSSGYGLRRNPFDGHAEFHRGVDFAAPQGTEVFAARDGVVIEVGFDPILGKMIVLAHDAGYQTIYGHLARIDVILKQEIRSGMIIGTVGSTGYSTGPHLHFEVRRGGSSRDPGPLLPAVRERAP
ncbi:MAG: M23 family metallopeptidase [Spirochaetales bacterium]|nr:M23 family metallopeptidase [Spirochaetales bacterium]